MKWMYYNGRLMDCREEKEHHDFFDIELFEHLTGKHINWEKREFTKVTSVRVRGHIRLYDEKFILGEKYKKNGKIYKCEHIDQSGLAMLTPQGNVLKVIATSESNEWEIV